jgi:hypothetical protein
MSGNKLDVCSKNGANQLESKGIKLVLKINKKTIEIQCTTSNNKGVGKSSLDKK